MKQTVVVVLILLSLFSFTLVPCYADDSSKKGKGSLASELKEVMAVLVEAAKTVSMGVEEFSKTTYGGLLWWYLFFKLIVAKVWQILGGLSFVLFCDYMLWKYTNKFFFGKKQKIVVADGTVTEKYIEEPYDFDSRDAKALIGAAFVFAGIIINIILLPIFLFG